MPTKKVISASFTASMNVIFLVYDDKWLLLIVFFLECWKHLFTGGSAAGVQSVDSAMFCCSHGTLKTPAHLCLSHTCNSSTSALHRFRYKKGQSTRSKSWKAVGFCCCLSECIPGKWGVRSNHTICHGYYQILANCWFIRVNATFSKDCHTLTAFSWLTHTSTWCHSCRLLGL